MMTRMRRLLPSMCCDLLPEYLEPLLQYFIPASFEAFDGWVDLDIGSDANVLEATTVREKHPLPSEVKTPSPRQ